MALEYSTDFPHEFDFIRASTTGAFWVAYTNKIYVGLPDEAELQEWVTLPGIPTDIAVSPRGDRIAWVDSGPPEGSNRLLVSDTLSAETLVLLEDPSPGLLRPAVVGRCALPRAELAQPGGARHRRACDRRGQRRGVPHRRGLLRRVGALHQRVLTGGARP